MVDLEAAFRELEDEFLVFDRVQARLHARPDLCAFLLLDTLLPNPGRDLVCAAEHDEIFLDIDCDELARVITEDDILTLVRCGVRYDRDTESLCMFV